MNGGQHSSNRNKQCQGKVVKSVSAYVDIGRKKATGSTSVQFPTYI